MTIFKKRFKKTESIKLGANYFISGEDVVFDLNGLNFTLEKFYVIVTKFVVLVTKYARQIIYIANCIIVAENLGGSIGSRSGEGVKFHL